MSDHVNSICHLAAAIVALKIDFGKSLSCLVKEKKNRKRENYSKYLEKRKKKGMKKWKELFLERG